MVSLFTTTIKLTQTRLSRTRTDTPYTRLDYQSLFRKRARTLIGALAFGRVPGVYLRSRSQGLVTSKYNLMDSTVTCTTYQVLYSVLFRYFNERSKEKYRGNITRKDAAQQNVRYHNREVKHHVYLKRQTRICSTCASFPFACRLLFIISTRKLVVSRSFFHP